MTAAKPDNATKNTGTLPAAEVHRTRRLSFAWLIPVLAIALAGYLGYEAWVPRGVRITIQFDNGHGLRPGDAIRYRGITVGEIQEVGLTDNLRGVLVHARLIGDAARFTRRGTRFWIVRPEVGFDGVAGLDTILGPRYIAVAPGNGARLRRFVGLAQPPVIDEAHPGDLEVIVESRSRGALRRGTAVTYRDLRIGTVMSVGLASDAGSVEARVHIRRQYVPLVRERTRFFDGGGFNAGLGWLKGLYLNVPSLETLMGGGIAIATPPDAGEIVSTGHRFALDAKPDEAWLDWSPLVTVGNELLPVGSPTPTPLRARLVWTEGRIFKDDEARAGWLLQTDGGLLGPADLMTPPAKARESTTFLEVAGARHPMSAAPDWTAGGLARLDLSLVRPVWPADRIRRPDMADDCIIVGDAGAEPMPLAAARLTADPDDPDRWIVDPAVSIDDSWHGAAVLSRADGRLVGILLVTDGTEGPVVALVPAPAAP